MPKELLFKQEFMNTTGIIIVAGLLLLSTVLYLIDVIFSLKADLKLKQKHIDEVEDRFKLSLNLCTDRQMLKFEAMRLTYKQAVDKQDEALEEVMKETARLDEIIKQEEALNKQRRL